MWIHFSMNATLHSGCETYMQCLAFLFSVSEWLHLVFKYYDLFFFGQWNARVCLRYLTIIQNVDFWFYHFSYRFTHFVAFTLTMFNVHSYWVCVCVFCVFYTWVAADKFRKRFAKYKFEANLVFLISSCNDHAKNNFSR